MKSSVSTSAEPFAVGAVDRAAVIHLVGELDPGENGALFRALVEIQALNSGNVVLDVSRATYCPAAAARLVARAEGGLRGRGVRFEIRAGSGAVREALRSAGLADRLSGPSADGADALAAEPASDRERRRAATMLRLRRMARLPADSPERLRLRDGVVEEHMNYARYLSHCYGRAQAGSGEDLDQVAFLGLVKAVDQFDPQYGSTFLGYATPMILGEIKRHFRDGTWAVHVPRRMQELSGAMYKAKDELRGELGREPSLPELAELLGVELEDVVAALDAAEAYQTSSLDYPVGDEEGAAPLGDLLGGEDPGFDSAMHHEVLRGLVAGLCDRDKRILLLRYFRGMSQAEIGREIGTSQMQVSRLLARIIEQLRGGFFAT